MDNPPLKMHYLKTSQIKKMSDDGDLYVNSNYQRGKVWKPKQKKSLIESIMNGSPIGALTIWEYRSKMEILDGQQRVNTINTFFENDFKNLGKNEQNHFQNYVIPCLEVTSTKESDVSAIFVRLQEGTPLNVAEKTHAITGKFKDEFMEIFHNNPLFFKNFSNRRLRATFMAAQFLALELKVNFVDEYPALNYEDFVKINKEYKEGSPISRIKNCEENIKFMYATLYNLLKKISPRDIISIYMLTSYLRANNKNYVRFGEQFREFVTMIKFELDRFSIYDKEAPKGMSKSKFDAFMEYKVIARKAATKDSLAKRFEFFFEEWSSFTPQNLHEKLTKEDFRKIPNFLPEELATKPFEEILKENESIYLEFSSSVFDSGIKSGKHRKYSQKIAETVAAFLNTDGGMLVFGVNSEKKMIGLQNDPQVISKEGWIEWEKEFSNFIEKMIGSQFRVYWSLEKIEYDKKIFAVVKIKKSLEPAYIKNNKTSLYTRYFGKNKKLSSKNKISYINVVFR